MIQNVFRAEGLPLDLGLHSDHRELVQDQRPVEGQCKGPWQFMKATAREHGLKTDWFIDERSDPEKATWRPQNT